MFEGVSAGDEGQGKQRVAVSGAMSLLMIGGLGVAAAAVGGGVVAATKDEPAIEVTFDTPAEPEPEIDEPPPPPPPPTAKPGKKKSSKPPSAPVLIPNDELEQADERYFKASTSADGLAEISEIGETEALGDMVASTPPPPPPPKQVVVGPERRVIKPVYIKDDVQPPVAASDNPMPEYPKVARRKGLEATVVLKVIIDEHGRVVHVKVVEGDEPFLGAVLAVVKNWKYKPALVDGRASAVYRLIRVPFRLKS
jgi:protein TonB